MHRLAPQPASAGPLSCRMTGFTLVELMVVLVIISILASLTLAGLGGVRQRAKADKTRSTIRKIDSVIQPMYENYSTRRVRISVSPAALISATNPRRLLATNRLENLRFLMAMEMPDTWGDVNPVTPSLSIPPWAQNSTYRRYRNYKTAISTPTSAKFNQPAANFPPGTTVGSLFGPAETLMMILSMSGFEPGCMEQFRSDEIGDIDADGATEFADGWGRPIYFIRWPAGYASPLIDRSQPDPLDVMRVTASITTPFPAQSDWKMVPLIYSAGPDEQLNDPLGVASGYGLQNPGPSWLASLPIVSTCASNSNGAINAGNPAAVNDNITNYELLKK